jgi:hypothetical protein
MSDSRNDMMISEMSEMANSNHELLKKMNSFLSTIPNDSIEKDTYGETIERDLENVKHNVLDNLKRITKMKDNLLFSRTTLNPGQIKELDKIKNLEEDSSNIVNNIEYKIERNKIVNKAIMDQTLEELAREKAMENIKKFPPLNAKQTAVLYENYPGRPSSDDDDDDDGHDQSSGGFRNRKNKTKNKKYTKKRTYKRPKKRVSKKNKTRKMKKNYL